MFTATESTSTERGLGGTPPQKNLDLGPPARWAGKNTVTANGCEFEPPRPSGPSGRRPGVQGVRVRGVRAPGPWGGAGGRGRGGGEEEEEEEEEEGGSARREVMLMGARRQFKKWFLSAPYPLT